MTEADDRQLELLKKVMLPSSIGLAYGKEIYGLPWVLYPWIAYMEQRVIEAILDDTHERYIIINAPPQTGKSSWCGELLPFWITGHFPDKNLMYLSYSDDFSVTKGKIVQGLHESYGRELFGSKVHPDFQSASEWRLAGHRGGMLSAGIGGLITGKPGDIIIVDDLIKNDVEARSQATKSSHIKEWDKTVHRRLQPGGTVIVIATRWVDDDFTGTMKERMKAPGYNGPKWEVLEFPAFAEIPEDEYADLSEEEVAAWRDIIGRMEDEVLDCRFSRIPGREPREFFDNVRNGMEDPFEWSCMYQQNPLTRTGGMFPKERWVYYFPEDRPAQFDQQVRVWDLAVTEGGGDWTCGYLMARIGAKFWVLDIKRFRKNAGNVMDAVKLTAEIDGHGVPIKIEEEKGGSGPTATAAYQKYLPGYDVSAAKAETSKESRAIPYSIEQNKQNILIPAPGTVPWDVRAFIDEHKRMMGDGRKPKNDDQIDTGAYCMIELLGGAGTEMAIPGQDVMQGLTQQLQMDALLGQGIFGEVSSWSPAGYSH